MAGDRAAYADLVRRHHPRVLRLCLSLLGRPADAEDAAQTAFIKAYERLDSFRGEASFATWLHRIAANVCLDLLRKSAREKADSLEVLEASQTRAWRRATAGPDEAAEPARRRDLLENILGPLSPEYRLALTLKEVQGLTYEEIAVELGWTLDSVKARLRRARLKLAENMRHFKDSPDVQKEKGS